MFLVADNFQITNPVIEKAVKNFAAKPIQDLIRKCEQSGADAIDINTGPLQRNTTATMAFLVDVIQDATDLPILVDTANPIAIKAALEASKKKIMINGFSLEPNKLAHILPLAKQYEADIIGYLLNPDGHVPQDASERLAIAVELYHHVKLMEMNPKRLIIDPVLVPLLWQNGSFQAKEILSVLSDLPNLLDFDVKTIIGLSNLTTGKADLNKKIHMEQTFLAMAAAAGLKMVLLNIFHSQTVKTAKTSNLIINPGIFSWEEIT